MEVVRIGGVELTPEEAEKYYSEGKYIVTYGCIYQLFYSLVQKTVYGKGIYRQAGMARKGRFFAMDAEAVNHLVGFELVKTEDISMAKILEFPKQVQKMSAGYHNLSRLIDLVDDMAELEFYAEAAVVGEEDGKLLPGEYEKLGEQIRKKRLELSRPEKKPAEQVSNPGLYLYCPEMGESRPECQIIAQRSYYGKHFHLSTPLSLKGRGITFDGIKEEKNLTERNKFMAGWNEYTVTSRAFEKLQEQYSISQESLLD